MVVGAIILTLFVVSSRADIKNNGGLLFWGLGIFLLGFFLWRRFPGPRPNPSGRFRILKKPPKKSTRARRPANDWDDTEDQE